MEKLNDMEQKMLIDELTQGRESANLLLKNHISPAASKEKCELLVQKILSSYDKALAVINLTAFLQDPSPVVGLMESPQSCDGISPKRESIYTDSRYIKKRKTLPRWSEQVRVCSGTGLENPVDDGYSWRKYGQKDILGATYPRAYYRCTHRHTKGCGATKQVQRSDEDPTIFDVVYKGKHTCIQALNIRSTASTFHNEKAKNNNYDLQKQVAEKQKQEEDILFSFGQGLKVETEEINSKEEVFPLFSFPSTPFESENLESRLLWEPLDESSFLSGHSPLLISPSTSESNYFSMSGSQMNIFGVGQNWQSSESDIISTPTSVTISPFDLVSPIDQVNFDPSFPVDILDYFA